MSNSPPVFKGSSWPPERDSPLVLRKPIVYHSSPRQLLRNALVWLCVVVLALQPLETMAAVQQHAAVFSAGQRELSAEFADFAEKDGALASMDSAPLAPRNSPYDALGVRTGAVVDGVASSLLWDRITGQLVDDGSQGYVQAPGVLAQLGAAGRGDLLADGSGSVRGIADANGLLVGTADFGVFGQNRGQAGAASSVGFGGAFWTAALRDQSQAPVGLVSAALFGALPTAGSAGNSSGVSTALAHLERLQQINPTPNRFVGSAEDTESGGGSGGSFGGFGGGSAPVGSPALALLLPQTSNPEPANQVPGPYTYASHRPTQGSGGTSALPGANPERFAAWLLGLDAAEESGGLAGLGQALVRVFLYVACVLDGECLASLTELQGLVDELGSSAFENMRWTGKLLTRAADLWPWLPRIPTPLSRLFSFGLGFVPVVGDLLDLYTGLTGYDPITGEQLEPWERALVIGSALMPLISASGLRSADEILDSGRELRFASNAATPGRLDPKDFDGIGQLFRNTFGHIPGADNVLSGLRSVEGIAKGASWQARYALQNLKPQDIVAFEQLCSNSRRRIDIVIRQGSRATFIEAKHINWYKLSEHVKEKKAVEYANQILDYANEEEGAALKIVIESVGSTPQWFIDAFEKAGIVVEIFSR